MILPSFKKLLSQDYDSQYKKLIDTLATSVNYAVESIYDAVTNNLTFRDNIKSTVKDITVTVDSTGKPVGSASIPLSITNATIDGVLVIGASNQTNSTTYPTSGVFVSGQKYQNTYIINNVTGLQAGQSYTLRIIILYQ